MGCYFKVILLSSLLNTIQSYNREYCCRSNHFQLLADNSRADAATILSEFAEVSSICSQLCLAQKLCTSFNYHSATKICQTLAYNHFENKAKRLIPSPGWSFYHQMLLQAENNCIDCKEWQTIDAAEDGVGCSCRDLENIALQKPTSQSSTCYYGLSMRAVDGDTNTNYGSGSVSYGSCSHTCISTSMWWMVDFGQSALVSSINITNRGDCCGERLSDFNIRIGDRSGGDGDENALCLSNGAVAQGETTRFECTSKLKGRYLYIKTNLQAALTLCEVKVFGEIL